MTRLGTAVPAVLLAIAACAGDSDPSGPDGGVPGGDESEAPIILDVSVEAPAVMLWDAGATMALTARAWGSGGQPIPGVAFEWLSEDPGVAAVEQGLVAATGDGWTEVGASAAGHAATVSVVVVTPDASPDRTDCIVCHADVYVRRHGSSGTPETCLHCHVGPSWSGGNFDHSEVADGFELLGAHASLECLACHDADGSPKYPGVAADECIACHQTDYDAGHPDSGYPTACLTCHTRDAWSPADFDHDARYFPIFSGRHSTWWNACGTCHFDPLDYSSFTCLACHPHDQQRMDARHSGVGGYGYDSDLCYACHPRGEIG